MPFSSPLIECPLCKESSPLAPQVEHKYQRCNQCALWFLLPQFRLDPTTEKSRYLLHTHDANDEGYKQYLLPLYSSLIQKLTQESKGLDYGSGPDSLLGQMLKEQLFSISSYDPYFIPDETVLSQSYDFVFSSEVCEHFYDPAFEFQRLRTLVKPNGILGIMTQMYDNLDFASWHYRKDPTHVVFYCKETFNWIASHLGWNEVSFIDKKTILLR